MAPYPSEAVRRAHGANLNYWDSVALGVIESQSHSIFTPWIPPLWGKHFCSTWNIRMILSCYWVPVSLKLQPDFLRPSLIWGSVPIDIESQSHYGDMGGGGQNFLRRHLYIYINMAIKKYAPHRILDLTALINQVIHKEFSWSSFPFSPTAERFITYHRCIVSYNILDT